MQSVSRCRINPRWQKLLIPYSRTHDISRNFSTSGSGESELTEDFSCGVGLQVCVCVCVVCVVFFAPYSTHSSGVATMFNNNFEFKIKVVKRDENRNFIIIISPSIMDKALILVNVYDPNKDNPTFYQNISVNKKG